MKLLRYGATRALIGDRTAALLQDYEKLLLQRGMADALTLWAWVGEGDQPEVLRVLIGQRSPLRIQQVDDSRGEPDNRRADLQMKEQIARLSSWWQWTVRD